MYDNTPHTERQLVLLSASYAALRRLVLEWHSKQTGEPMNLAEHQLHLYIEEELDHAMRELPPGTAALVDPRRPLPPP
jgi:hypothetical protein